MRELPILFSGAMVRAILDGRKTQTRRIVKPQPDIPFDVPGITSPFVDGSGKEHRCPYGHRGDRLYVKEAFRFPKSLDWCAPGAVALKALDAGYSSPWCPTQYEADGHQENDWRGFETPPVEAVPGKLRPGIHMPRWASRITLEVTGVRVERLQDISEDDAIAEGVDSPDLERYERDWSICPQCGGTRLYDAASMAGVRPDTDCLECDTHAKRYRHLWNSLNAARGYGWDVNPWVWVVEFTRAQP